MTVHALKAGTLLCMGAVLLNSSNLFAGGGSPPSVPTAPAQCSASAYRATVLNPQSVVDPNFANRQCYTVPSNPQNYGNTAGYEAGMVFCSGDFFQYPIMVTNTSSVTCAATSALLIVNYSANVCYDNNYLENSCLYQSHGNGSLVPGTPGAVICAKAGGCGSYYQKTKSGSYQVSGAGVPQLNPGQMQVVYYTDPNSETGVQVIYPTGLTSAQITARTGNCSYGAACNLNATFLISNPPNPSTPSYSPVGTPLSAWEF